MGIFVTVSCSECVLTLTSDSRFSRQRQKVPGLNPWPPEHMADIPPSLCHTATTLCDASLCLFYPLCILCLTTLSAVAFTPITGCHVNEHFNYASSAVHTPLSLSLFPYLLQQVPTLLRLGFPHVPTNEKRGIC